MSKISIYVKYIRHVVHKKIHITGNADFQRVKSIGLELYAKKSHNFLLVLVDICADIYVVRV